MSRPRLLSADDCTGSCTPGVHSYREGCAHSPYAAGDARALAAAPPATARLTWAMRLNDDGYTEHRLADMQHQRWGWIINADETGWTAHVGNFGQSAQHAPVLDEKIASFDTVELGQAKAWVENEVALQWKNQRQTKETPA